MRQIYKRNLRIIALLKKNKVMTFGQLVRATGASSYDPIRNAVEFLKAASLVDVKEKADNRGSKQVRLVFRL